MSQCETLSLSQLGSVHSVLVPVFPFESRVLYVPVVSVYVCVWELLCALCSGQRTYTLTQGSFYRPSASRIDLATFGPTTDPHPIHTTAAPQETVHSLRNLPPLQARRVYGQSWGNKSLSPLSGIWSPATKGPLWRKHKAGRSISRGGEVRAAVKPR